MIFRARNHLRKRNVYNNVVKTIRPSVRIENIITLNDKPLMRVCLLSCNSLILRVLFYGGVNEYLQFPDNILKLLYCNFRFFEVILLCQYSVIIRGCSCNNS
jgi:hypothetical protein